MGRLEWHFRCRRPLTDDFPYMHIRLMTMRSHFPIRMLRFCCLFALLLAAGAAARAQEDMSVEAFYYDEHDMTANTPGTKREDINGYTAALIKVETTQKGFTFDVGSSAAIIETVQQPGAIWVYVPPGVKRFDIAHSELGVCHYEFPEPILQGRTYVLKLASRKLFVNVYDDAHKQTLHVNVGAVKNAELSINGMRRELSRNGTAQMELSFGVYTWRITAPGYRPKEGRVEINDSVNAHVLNITDLDSIKGSLEVKTLIGARLEIDGNYVGTVPLLEPVDYIIGSHRLTVQLDGYRKEERDFELREGETTYLDVPLSQYCEYRISTSPSSAIVYIDNKYKGYSPVRGEYTTGYYDVKVQRRGYRDYHKRMHFNSSEPNIRIRLKRNYRRKNEFYIEGNAAFGTLTALGGTMGFYASNLNFEGSYLMGMDESEPVYWSNGADMPVRCTYKPSQIISGKFGFGIGIANCLRMTPQVGVYIVQGKESYSDEGYTIAGKPSVVSGLCSLRLTVGFAKCLGLSVTPEYAFPVSKSKGFEKLEAVSPKIQKWGNGFSLKAGFVLLF